MNDIFTSYGYTLTSKELDAFEVYKNLLIEWNSIINLTAILDERDIAIKHFLDSYSIAKTVFEGSHAKTVLDMGTGGGFPGVVSGILYPDIDFTLVDSVNKKITFVEKVVEALQLKNVHPKHHYLDKKNSSGKKFDLVISRAFMKPHKLIYFAKSYVKKGGKHIMLLTENQFNQFSEFIEKFKPEVLTYPYEGRQRYILSFTF